MTEQNTEAVLAADAALMRVALADWDEFVVQLAVLLNAYGVELDGDGTEQTVCIDRIREALERAQIDGSGVAR